VGAGKTFLMDLFYEALPFSEKTRMHFHVFMREVHEALKGLQGHKNPLKVMAKRLAKRARVICFDEFFVSDITDAMLLAGLLDEMFSLGMVLVATLSKRISPFAFLLSGVMLTSFGFYQMIP